MSDFSVFKSAVAVLFANMSNQNKLFVADVTGDQLWEAYLEAFPPGTNPIFRTRREYDCQCCRQFIRRVGNVVAIEDGRVTTIWNIKGLPYPFQDVADTLGAMVRNAAIKDVFLTSECQAGADWTRDAHEPSITWEHFYATIPTKFFASKLDIGAKLGEARTTKEVYKRGLDEIKPEAVKVVLELVAQGSLYKGAEFKPMLLGFQAEQARYAELSPVEKDLFAWVSATPPKRLRNTLIGTLLMDLTNDVDVEQAVSAYESKAAPENYKRPKSLVTPRMIQQAKETVAELGLTTAIERRHAKVDDISVNDVLFVDRSVRSKMKDAFDILATKATGPQDYNFDRVAVVSAQSFVTDVLPNASKVEVFVESKHTENLVTLIAPDSEAPEPLFKWGNSFSWTYNGGFTDSVQERVKLAGGDVEGVLCCSLGWFNTDDLDLHCQTPVGNLYFGRKQLGSGALDVDMNASSLGLRTDPVENIVFKDFAAMPAGRYVFVVNNYQSRASADHGFEVTLVAGGEKFNFSYNKPIAQGAQVPIAQVEFSKPNKLKVTPFLEAVPIARDMWGMRSNNFVPVKLVSYSPNFWGEKGVGHQHLFFILDGCANPEPVRGFYNEFLRPELTPHRKVFEVLAGSTQVPAAPADEQLSGLGFSMAGKKAEVVCRVTGTSTRVIKIQF